MDSPSTSGSVNTTEGNLGEEQDVPPKSLPYKPPLAVSLVVSGFNRPVYTLR